jgi:deoxycytidylate deaminase
MIKSRDIKYLNIAGKLAMLSTFPKHPTGCVVTLRNDIISTGFNSEKSHPLQKKYNVERNIPDWSIHKIHAEVDALKNIIHLNIDWSKVRIYIYRKRSNQPYGMARPCESCMALIRDLKIPNIYYTTDYGYAHEKLIY